MVYNVYSRLNKQPKKEDKMGYKIKEIRESKGMSQEELAERANISRTIIWNLETNPNAETTTKTLKKIAEALDTTVSAIFFETDGQ
jgi:transcriptional regulator with XRE-family HTH domain